MNEAMLSDDPAEARAGLVALNGDPDHICEGCGWPIRNHTCYPVYAPRELWRRCQVTGHCYVGKAGDGGEPWTAAP
jgi:hypothetical protein